MLHHQVQRRTVNHPVSINKRFGIARTPASNYLISPAVFFLIFLPVYADSLLFGSIRADAYF